MLKIDESFVPQIFSRSTSRVTSWPGREASSTKILAAWGRSRMVWPDLRNSPVTASSSKTLKRSGGVPEGAVAKAWFLQCVEVGELYAQKCAHTQLRKHLCFH